MKKNYQNFIKYIYISANILLAFYILVNTSFLQTTLYKYLAQQNGLTKSGTTALMQTPLKINLNLYHSKGIDHHNGKKPFDAAKIYFLLAVVSTYTLFTPKNSVALRSLKETFRFFKRFIPFLHHLLCIGGLSLRAPPVCS